MQPLPGYEGRYSAAPSGHIYSHLTGRFLKPRPLPNGYLRANLVGTDGRAKDYLIHRLVCSAYYGQSKLDVNHKDCDKSNNKPENLEWCTKSENMQHAFAHGCLSPQRKATRLRNKTQFSVAVRATSLRDGSQKTYPSMASAEVDGFSHSKVSLCVRGLRNSHKGYTWEVAL